MTRLAAWRILRSGSSTLLRDVDRLADAHAVDPRDRGLLRRIVGTEVRRRATLRAIVHSIAPAMKSSEMLAHAHIALTQILFLDRVPEHAILAEASDAVRRTLGPAKVRIIREFIKSAYARLETAHVGDPRRDLVGRNLSFREPVFRDPAQHPLLWAEDAYSLPAPLLKRWYARYGEAHALALAKLALDEAPLSIRVVRGERAALQGELSECAARPGAHERILIAPSSAAEQVTESTAFREGRITIQGESALRAAEFGAPVADEEWLDLCAAPGGKTAVLAAAGARVVACDVSQEKVARIRSTLERLGAGERVELVVTDAGAALGERMFDAVLVDAPCTNTGVLAQRPEARWRFGPKTKDELVALQARLFERASTFVRPGGRLVWSTCSLEPEENRRAVEHFLGEHAGWSLEGELASLPDVATTHERGAGPIDGGYVARLRRP
ncbi:MAG: hypothetical protein IT454_04180 [Planctomycetes bacterium]|nr:hypothetical protein [Planctomycetota bacterium]